jgi:hypothetical protein
MSIDPFRRWQSPPSVAFCAPAESLSDDFRSFFLERFGATLSQNDAAWLAGLLEDFISYRGLFPGPNAMHAAAIKLLPILAEIDREMSQSKTARARWMPIAFGLGLPSSYETRQARVARSRGVSKQNLTNQVSRFLRAVDLRPAFSGNGRHLAVH